MHTYPEMWGAPLPDAAQEGAFRCGIGKVQLLADRLDIRPWIMCRGLRAIADA